MIEKNAAKMLGEGPSCKQQLRSGSHFILHNPSFILLFWEQNVDAQQIHGQNGIDHLELFVIHESAEAFVGSHQFFLTGPRPRLKSLHKKSARISARCQVNLPSPGARGRTRRGPC